MVRYTEHLPNAPPDDRDLPDLSFAFYDRMVVFDHVSKTNVVVAMARLDQFGDDLQAAYDDAQRRVDELVARLEAPDAELPPADIDTGGEPHDRLPIELRPGRVRAGGREVRGVHPGRRHLSGRPQPAAASCEIDGEPFEIYRTLRVVNPSPFMFYLRTPSVTLVGSSPEIMVRVVDGTVTVRPLAGTRRRGATEEEDRRLAEELLADPKERAEHVMLVDLGRNDVGRVARYRHRSSSPT